MAFGKWLKAEKNSFLGRGGNANVYKVSDIDDKNSYYALKTLKDVREKSYSRFKDEITALINLQDVIGVVNIIEYNLDSEQPYYVMPLGVSIDKYLYRQSPLILCQLFKRLIETLIILHNRDYTHRDIKPSNILIINGYPCFSDFGLVDFPNKSKITKTRESVGPKWTIAPEMKRNSTISEFKKADVYSLAKTLWILITKNETAFEGQYDINGIMSISKNKNLKSSNNLFDDWNFNSTILLEKLLTKATDSNPENRPSCEQFYNEFVEWFDTSNEFKHSNLIEWDDTLLNLFPYGLPKHAEWKKIEIIHNVLQMLTKYPNLNYCFLPVHGGTDFSNIRVLKQKNELLIIELRTITPKKLR